MCDRASQGRPRKSGRRMRDAHALPPRTGKLHLGAFIAGTEVITKIGLYYFHERAWARVKWGLRQP